MAANSVDPRSSTRTDKTTPGASPLPTKTTGITTTSSSTSSETPQGTNTGVSTRTPVHSSATTTSTSQSTRDASAALASNTSTSNPADTGITSSGNGKFTGGELAGGIVGAALGAAIIAFLATFLLCRRRNNKSSPSPRRYEDSSPRWTPMKGDVTGGEKPSADSDNYGLGWQAYLPDSADDRTVRKAVKTLFDQIELHVDNYYSKVDVDINDGIKADLALLDSNKLPIPLAQMMIDPQRVRPTIKHCIANLLIAKITPGDNVSRSLLPARVAAMPPRLENSSMPAGEYHATQQAYSQWKSLNAFLFPPVQKETIDQRRIQSVSNELAESIYLAFMPWQSQQQDEEALKQHEVSLMTKASDVGQFVQSQPSAYEFEWTSSSGVAQFDVLPGFVKTSDGQGRPLASHQTLVPATNARL